MAVLILPSRRTRQPQTIARPSSYWLSRGLVFLYNGATFVDHAYEIPATNSGSIARRVNPSGGIAADISGSQYLAWASRDALNLTGALAIIWKGRFDGTTGAYRTVVSKPQSNGVTNTPFESYVDTTSGKLAFIRANGTGNRYFQCDTTVVPANTDLSIFVNAAETIETTPTIYINATAQTLSGSGTVTGSATASTTDLRIGRRVDNGTQFDGGVELVALFNQQLSTDDYLRFRSDPWGEAFAPDPRRLYFGVSGGATAYTLDAQPGGYTVSGTAATLARGIVIDAQPATYTVSGTAATLVRGYNLNAQPGTFTATGTAASLVRGYVVDAAPGSFSLTGVDATLEKVTPGVYTLDAQPGSYSLTGVAATLTYTPLNAYTLDAQPGTYTLTGAAATLTYAGASIWTDVGVSSVTWSDVGGASSIWSDI